MKHISILKRLSMACLLVCIAQTGFAQSSTGFPEQPIQLVVGFSAGGPADNVARTISQRLGHLLDTSIAVVNRPGADGVIAAGSVARARPDGYTLLLAPSTLAINESMYKQLSYDTRKSFVPVAMLGESPNIIAVHPSLPIDTIEELTTYSRKPDVKLFYGSSSSVTLLATEMLKLQTGTKMEKVPYKGAGQALPALLGNEVQVMVSSVLTLLPHVQSKKVKALAVTGRSRLPIAPDIPTTAEQGMPDYAASTWYGLFAPADVPAPILSKISEAINRLLADKDVLAQFARQGLMVDKQRRDQAGFTTYFENEIEKWEKVVIDSKISAN